MAPVPEPRSMPPSVSVDAPVPPLATVRSVVNVTAPETVRAPVISRATDGFVVPMPTNPAALMVMPEEVALKAAPGVIRNLFASESSTPINHAEEGVAPVRKSIYGSNVLVFVSLEIVSMGEIVV